ncbi:hypothetical protein OF117_21905, partial [Geodermatophilus sp. YIM 151500]|uniref:serine/threonine-protein kinase n=1 Tax=Geodermatophilus sp. YIM 151500 TaxID=2984531 RepID=UPI00398CD789|nr:hypothetical protein [Geodermatophilus sp. YIM 151500]
GLTKRTADLSGGLTGTGHFLGTVDYVSPEQIQGRPVGPGTDIYALGCMLHECLTGRLPFRRDDDAALLWAHLVETPPPVTGSRPEIPGAVNLVVARAMAKDPADRYQSCHELLHDLQLALGMPATVSTPRRRDSRGSGGGPRAATARPDGSRTELGTVTGDVFGGSQHPSFPPGPLERNPGRAAAAHGSVPGDSDRGLEEQPPDSSGDDYRQGYEDQYRDDYPDEYREGYPDEYRDDDAGWDQGEPGPPPAPPRRMRRWKPVAIGAAVAVVLLAVAAVFLRSALLSEDYRSYASGGTLVPFTLDHPADWASAVGPSSDVVLAPDPTAADQLFFFRGTPDAWASATGTVRANAPENVWLYVYTSAATLDTSSAQALQDSVVPLLPMTTRIESGPRQVPVAGAPAQEMEAVTSDPEDPQTALRALVDVVQPPGAGGAVLLAFFAPPETFEEHRPVFERIRDSLEITR